MNVPNNVRIAYMNKLGVRRSLRSLRRAFRTRLKLRTFVLVARTAFAPYRLRGTPSAVLQSLTHSLLFFRYRETLWKNIQNHGIIFCWKEITSNIEAKMGKGEDVSMESLRKICIALDCEIGDIMEVNAADGE